MTVARPPVAAALRLLVALAGLLLTAPLLPAQVSSGSFYGSIEDPSGGLLAGVHIEIRQEKTGFVRRTSTGTTGLYRLPDLAPGVYSVTVQRNGFRTSVAPHVSLEINQEARLDFQLEIGAAHETVTVADSASPLQTADNSVGYRFDSSTFTQLPIDGRNVLSLVTLGPGAIPRQLGGFVHDTNNDIQQGSRGSVALNPPINGARSSMNTYLLDGAYNTDRNTFATVVIPPMDSVEEFRIQSSLAAPAFSRPAAASLILPLNPVAAIFMAAPLSSYETKQPTPIISSTTLPLPVRSFAAISSAVAWAVPCPCLPHFSSLPMKACAPSPPSRPCS